MMKTCLALMTVVTLTNMFAEGPLGKDMTFALLALATLGVYATQAVPRHKFARAFSRNKL